MKLEVQITMKLELRGVFEEFPWDRVVALLWSACLIYPRPEFNP